MFIALIQRWLSRREAETDLSALGRLAAMRKLQKVGLDAYAGLIDGRECRIEHIVVESTEGLDGVSKSESAVSVRIGRRFKDGRDHDRLTETLHVSQYRLVVNGRNPAFIEGIFGEGGVRSEMNLDLLPQEKLKLWLDLPFSSLGELHVRVTGEVELRVQRAGQLLTAEWLDGWLKRCCTIAREIEAMSPGRRATHG